MRASADGQESRRGGFSSSAELSAYESVTATEAEPEETVTATSPDPDATVTGTQADPDATVTATPPDHDATVTGTHPKSSTVGPGPAPGWWHRPRRFAGRSVPAPAAALAWLAAFAAVVALFYNMARRVEIVESDMATPVLQAQSILQGHVLLGGWRMLYDSFWTVEVPFYTVGVWITGVDPVLLYVVPAVLAALLVLAAGTLARQGLRGGAAVAAVGTLIALIGLPSNVWAVVFLHGAWHVGTMLWCLLAFAGLRSSRWGAGWWIAVVLLAAGVLGDLQTAVYGVAPVAIAGVLASLRTRRWLGGAPALTAAAASVAAAWLIRKAADALGGYTVGTINASASNDQMHANLRNIPGWLPQVFGAGTGDWGNTGVPAALGAVRYVALAAVLLALLVALGSAAWGAARGVGGLALGLRSMVRAVFRRDAPGRETSPGSNRAQARPTGRLLRLRTAPGAADHWRIDDMLLLACLGDLAFYVYAAQSNLLPYLRYLAPFVVFGSVLAARTTGRWSTALRPGVVRRGLAAAGTVVTALFAASFIITSVQPVQPVTGADLARFLADHQLTNGIGTYWTATMTTVASGGTVTVRPVIADSGKIVRYGRQSTADWYAGQQFQFLVFDTANPWGDVDAKSAIATFGPMVLSYRVGTYQVLRWLYPVTIDPDKHAG